MKVYGFGDFSVNSAMVIFLGISQKATNSILLIALLGFHFRKTT